MPNKTWEDLAILALLLLLRFVQLAPLLLLAGILSALFFPRQADLRAAEEHWHLLLHGAKHLQDVARGAQHGLDRSQLLRERLLLLVRGGGRLALVDRAADFEALSLVPVARPCKVSFASKM